MNFVRRLADHIFIIHKDDDVNTKGRKLAFSATACIWIVLCVLSVSVHFKPSVPEYKEIRITLTEPQNLKTLAKLATPSAEPRSYSAQTSQPAQKESTRETSPEVSPVQTSPASKTPSPSSQPARQAPKYTLSKPTYAKSNEELLAEQLSSRKKTESSEWNDSVFNDGANTVVSGSAGTVRQKRIADSDAVRGSSGSAASSASEPASGVSSSSDSRFSQENLNVSGSVKESLSGIGAIRPRSFSSSGNSVTSTALLGAASYSSSDGGASGISIAMTDGSVRRLLEPKEPVIRISNKNAESIETSVELKIKFRILPNGNVLLSGITMPSSSLSPAVQTEIKEQIVKWRFAQSSSESTAVFDLTIVKK
ncbi:hypothetical protein HRQ91_02580 [Treponema parvum]|uniref:Uncharacterized protein n=1 Tax=Treponema parvum TaxID=138851 RepID=A0A975F2Q4_9SPIR|nr:hypothetical protein [Treponema parvum]QTQ13429.1 hypothetical protein HRQ91_02580 [Treponema parvum]